MQLRKLAPPSCYFPFDFAQDLRPSLASNSEYQGGNNRSIPYNESVSSLAKTFLIRFTIALGVVAAGSWLLVWGPYSRARETVLSEITRREANRDTRSYAQDRIEGIAPPSNIPLRQRDAWKSYANTINQISDKISATELILPKKLPAVPFTPMPALRALVKDVNSRITDPNFGQRYKRASEAFKRTDQLLSYHAATVSALANLLEYDPAVDFKQFDIGSEDTQKRLDLAKEGLDRTKKELEEAVPLYSNPSLSEVMESVDHLQQELTLLEQKGDKNRWIREVGRAQSAIVANRDSFWTKERASVIGELKAAEAERAEILNRWIEIRDTFDL